MTAINLNAFSLKQKNAQIYSTNIWFTVTNKLKLVPVIHVQKSAGVASSKGLVVWPQLKAKLASVFVESLLKFREIAH